MRRLLLINLKTINWLKNFNKLHEDQKPKIKKNEKIKETKDIFFENLSKIDEKISNIVVFTRQGYVIEKILSINPALNIIIFTDNQKCTTFLI